MGDGGLEARVKEIEDYLSKLPKNYSERFTRLEKLIFDLASFLTNWIFISVQIDRDKYVSIIGKEKFEEFKDAIASFVAEVESRKGELKTSSH